MTAALCNMPLPGGALQNRFGGRHLRGGPSVHVGRNVTVTVTVTRAELTDEMRVLKAMASRGNRPIRSYRSLEDLMREFDD